MLQTLVRKLTEATLCHPERNPFIHVASLGPESETHGRASYSHFPSLIPEEDDLIVPVQYQVDEPLPRRYLSALRRLLRLRPQELDAFRKLDPTMASPRIALCLCAVSLFPVQIYSALSADVVVLR